MKKTIKTILLTLCLALCLCLVPTLAKHNFAYASGSAERTIFIISPSHILATDSGTFVYDNSDKSIKQLNQVSANSKSYYVGDILDITAQENYIYALAENVITIYSADSGEIEAEIDLDWWQNEYAHISVSNLEDQVVLCVYGDSIETPIKYGVLEDNVWQFYDITITAAPSVSTEISSISFADFADSTYLIRTNANLITLYEVSLSGDIDHISTNTPLVDVDNDGDIIFAQLIDNIIYVSYADSTAKYELAKENSSIDANILTSKTHTYGEETNFNAKGASYNDGKLFLLADDCYYVLNAETFEYTDKVENLSCTPNLIENKSNYNYYKVNEQSKLISTLGKSSTIIVPQNTFVVEIANCTLSDQTALVGYKYVLYAALEEHDEVKEYVNYYGYLLYDEEILEQVEIEESHYACKVDSNTKLYAYPSVKIDSSEAEIGNSIIYNISGDSYINVIAELSPYQTGINDGEHAVSYALVNVNGQVGFIDLAHKASADRRIINVMPNAKVVAKTNVYLEADINSEIIYELEKDANVRILEARNRAGFIKIAFNNAQGLYYEGYVLASNVHSNSFTTLQIIGAVLVVVNLIFLAILFATRRKLS